MDIKDLNKSQLILLAILLSFITSIATGITTVTLMEQAPPSVTVPINRVVRQTVEKIEQVQGKTITQTVVIKEEDLVVDAIAKNQSAVFSVSRDGFDEIGTKIEVSAGRGFAVSEDGLVITDGSAVWSGGVYYLSNSSGKFEADFVAANPAGFALLKIGEPISEGATPSFTVPVFGDLNAMKVGQKVLVFGETISSFILDSNQDIKINTVKANSGALVLNLDGEALGIALSNEAASFASIGQISEALKAQTEEKI